MRGDALRMASSIMSQLQQILTYPCAARRLGHNKDWGISSNIGWRSYAVIWAQTCTPGLLQANLGASHLGLDQEELWRRLFMLVASTGVEGKKCCFHVQGYFLPRIEIRTRAT